jgi:hypothetical protein
MKLFYSLLLFFLSLTSCAQKTEPTINDVKTELDSIHISKIKTACDCSDGMEKIADILFKTTDKFSSKTEVMNDVFGAQVVELTTQKTKEVAKICTQLGFNDPDIKDCPSFKSLEEKSKILIEKFKN